LTITSFADFGLAAPLTAALMRADFNKPTPIQAQAIGPQLEGRDILGIAQTGTGKTAAFSLPILHHILALSGRAEPKTTRALILAPTRELAVQIEQHIKRLAGGARITTALVLGGMSRGVQIRQLARGVDILIATPGRLTDLVGERHVRLDQARWVVLDEADRMLDMGFIREVRKLVGALHPRRQSALFSATMPPEVAKLAEGLLNNPVRVAVATHGDPIGKIDQSVELMTTGEKRARLAAILSAPEASRVIVFARTKRGADRVAQNLGKDGIRAEAIHGNKAQNARNRAMDAFRSGRVKVLVATDIAARGIDVVGISHVINYDLPDEAESYVHRIGRTARNGADGIAITLCAPDERNKLRAVEKLTRIRLAPDLGPDEAISEKPRGRVRRRRFDPANNGADNGAKPGPKQGFWRGAKPGAGGHTDGQSEGKPKRHRRRRVRRVAA
jgi:ATP-dependent RNA helicase RhlE